jgi:hypothetical protein
VKRSASALVGDFKKQLSSSSIEVAARPNCWFWVKSTTKYINFSKEENSIYRVLWYLLLITSLPRPVSCLLDQKSCQKPDHSDTFYFIFSKYNYFFSKKKPLSIPVQYWYLVWYSIRDVVQKNLARPLPGTLHYQVPVTSTWYGTGPG